MSLREYKIHTFLTLIHLTYFTFQRVQAQCSGYIPHKEKMVLKFKSVQYVIIFTIYLLDEFHQTSPQNEIESKSVSSSKSNQEPMLHVNSTQMPTLDPQSNSFVQPTTLRLQHNLTVQPTASTEVVQSPSEEIGRASCRERV